ncbi:uncharacterized protein [Clytia hemisphaerica]|uniref:uncharacterized protein n=1 Tax=Clytia hemisphaerica TaxID=252671 RepID=UPI0034D66C08
MKINVSKCKTISDSPIPIQINNENVENVSDFVFPGSNVPGTTNDIKRRMGLVCPSFGRLRDQIWRNKDINLKLDTEIIRRYTVRRFRSLLGLTLMDRVRNVEIRNRLGITTTIIDINRKTSKRCFSWFSNILRRDLDNPVNIAFKDNFTNPKPRGRPPKRWGKTK